MLSKFYKLLIEHTYKKLTGKLITFLVSYILYALVEIYVFSNVISNLINNIRNSTSINKKTYLILRNFLFFLVLYIIFLLYYKYNQINFLLLIKTEVRQFLFHFILNSNDNKYIEKNYVKFSSLINRVTEKIFWSLNNVVVWILPTFVTIIIVAVIFFIYDKYAFLFFLLINFLIIYSLVRNYKNYENNSVDFEKSIVDVESKQVETLNNFDKIIFRGFSELETNIFRNMHDNIVKNGRKYYYSMLGFESLNISLVNISIFLIIVYFIYIKKSNNITFIITLLLLYRSKIESSILRLADMMEIISKLILVDNNFEELVNNFSESKIDLKKININTIEFKNIYFKYPNTPNYVFRDLNLKLDFNKDKIIGLFGHSGSGKSTLCKLLIKIYGIDSGIIKINNIDTKDYNSRLLKRNITYINQNNKLFDNDVEYNLKYGCSSNDKCDLYLNKILNYDNLTNVFHKKSNEEIMKINTGFLGEKISGGQRQIINVLNGMIYPTEILVLDEPTSNLDVNTKKNLIKIIKIFKEYKKGIIIITHDDDLIPLFDRIINMDKLK